MIHVRCPAVKANEDPERRERQEDTGKTLIAPQQAFLERENDRESERERDCDDLDGVGPTSGRGDDLGGVDEEIIEADQEKGGPKDPGLVDLPAQDRHQRKAHIRGQDQIIGNDPVSDDLGA